VRESADVASAQPSQQPATTSTRAAQCLTLTPQPESVAALVRRLWSCRQLVSMLTRREFFSRYRRASLGLLWTLALPGIQAVVLVAVFSHVVRVQTTIPYATFVLAGIGVWTSFNSAMGNAATAVVANSGLASKIYFPRVILPLVMVLSYAFSLLVATLLVVVVGIIQTHHVGIEILLLAPADLLVIGLALGFGMVFSAVHVYFRDTSFLIAAITLPWFYMTPIFYPLDLTSGALRAIVLANPITGAVEMMRAAIAGTDTLLLPSALVSVAWLLALLALGTVLHARFDRRFTDLL
jgi:ABC-type polysaccharide/polyol phosphate export permease